MRLRNVPGAGEILAASEYVVDEPEKMKGRWRELFGRCARAVRKAPLHVEIGMGKGAFLHQMALLHDDIDYVGIERYSSVLVKAVSKLEAEPVNNVKLVCADAEELLEMFDPGEADRVYLNFSDPWPKARHAKRRLPGREFLERFGQILSPEGMIEFKTDNRKLFDFAVEEAKEAGWKFEALTYDLHHDVALREGNVMTEYEEKFSAMGNPICKYIIYRIPK
ncbi:MAG: tRNA (guanosine(46)-N7)-methyltransferase TrmB [Lachnospiraceae bacterium]|nr:tRNA (guanosine(46)-N7)-methyltransferase TrmB [Lachnospiraceae bacterium]